MTYAVTVLAAACCVLGFLLVCALVGGADQRDRLQAKVEHRDARIEDLENELRHRSRGNHPAGKGLRVVDATHCDWQATGALREALTERDAGHDGGGGVRWLSDTERAVLAPWDDGSYSCACPGDCPVIPCRNGRGDLMTTVERIVAEATTRAREQGRREAAQGDWMERQIANTRHEERRRILRILVTCECPHEGPYAAPCQGLRAAVRRASLPALSERGSR